MKAKDLRKLPWVEVTDWSKVPTHEKKRRFKGPCIFVSETDLECFIMSICNDISREVNMPYKEIYKLIKEENKAFYTLKDKLYTKWTGLGTEDVDFESLKKLFKVPYVGDSKVENCKILFKQLSPEERMQFLLDTFSITLEAIKLQAKEINEINKAKEEEDSP